MQRRSLVFLHLIKLAANGRQSNFEVFGYLAQGERSLTPNPSPVERGFNAAAIAGLPSSYQARGER